jgi:hypothetical protein
MPRGEGSSEDAKWVTDGASGITTSTAPRHMCFVPMTLDELDDIRSSGNDLEIAFLGICTGALLTVSVTLATVELPELTKLVFITLTVVFSLASSYLGLAAYNKHVKWKRRFRRYEQLAQTAPDTRTQAAI